LDTLTAGGRIKVDASPERLILESTGRALRQFRLTDAAALAETASALTQDPHQQIRLHAVSRMARAYGAFFLSTPTEPGSPKLAFELSIPAAPAFADLMQEANRLKQLYEEALRHPAGIALVHWMHAYHAAANFDGLRVMLWLARAIAALDTTITVDRQLRGLGEALQEGLDAAVGRVGAVGQTPEPYASLQVVNDAWKRLAPAQQAPLDRTSEFTMQTDLTFEME